MTPSFVIYNMYSEMSPGIDMHVMNLQKFACNGQRSLLILLLFGY